MTTLTLPKVVYRPRLYYILVFLISWSSWFLAAYFSYQTDQQLIALLLACLGLFGPMIASIIMFFGFANAELRQDYLRRLLNYKTISLYHLALIIAIILFSLLLATAISLCFGYSITQFSLSNSFWLMLPFAFIAATFEELGWRTYGVDSLLANHTILSATLWFTLLWGLWHVPLFFINQTYQNELYHLGPLYVVNFFISILPATILANWFYYRCYRSVPAAIIFHFLLVASAELLQTDPQTKWLITALLLIISLAIIKFSQPFFNTKINSQP